MSCKQLLTNDPGIRTERVKKLRSITQAEYNRLLFICKQVIPARLCDPADALSHGLLVALDKYDGRGALSTYVTKCAWYYALQQVKKRRYDICFCDLETEEDFEDYLDAILPALDDPRYIEAVDELFIRRIEQVLHQSKDYRYRFSTKEAIDDAIEMLSVLRTNANLGHGIGIDEYDDAPLTSFKHGRKRRERPTHNTKVVRRQIVGHFADALRTDPRDISSAFKGLRLATRQALNEGWLQ